MKKLDSRFLAGGFFFFCTLFAFSAFAAANPHAAPGHSRIGSIAPNGSADLHLVNVAVVAGPRAADLALRGTLAITTQDTATSSPPTAALFPIIGLIVAISATQLLRRRRMAQQRSSSPGGI